MRMRVYGLTFGQNLARNGTEFGVQLVEEIVDDSHDLGGFGV